MKRNLYNLQDFSQIYGLKATYGAKVAYLYLDYQSFLKADSISYCLDFYSIFLVHKGEVLIQVNNT
ncbi:MAG: hypothetical protein LKF81_10960, partial [Prevotella sp.]|nr:hypothetical protein [Prevotella sp.]